MEAEVSHDGSQDAVDLVVGLEPLREVLQEGLDVDRGERHGA